MIEYYEGVAFMNRMDVIESTSENLDFEVNVVDD